MSTLKKLLGMDWLMLAAMLVLIGCGTVAIWSAGMARETVFHGMWKNHLATACLGLVCYLALAVVDYRIVVRLFAPVAYALSLLMLVVVLFAGDTVYGGRRWLWFFQPSEIAKVCSIAFLAGAADWAASAVRLRRGKLAADEFDEEEDAKERAYAHGPVTFFFASLAAAIPAALILLEPDLGTTLAFVPAVAAMLIALSIWRKGLFTMLAIVAVASSILLGAVYEAEKPGQSEETRERILAYVPLKPHQVKRVKTFLFPESDPMGAGYNLRQSRITIASGGISGKGLGKAQMNRLKYLPASVSMNDFIFCVWAEETGYIGSLALVSLFALLCMCGVKIAFSAADPMGRALALGTTTLIFSHAYINMAMCVGLVPITGLPLPFISSGRTFLVAVMAALGLAQSVHIHNKEEKENTTR